MAVKFPEKLTAETLPDAWRYADRKLRWAKKGSLIYRSAAFVTFPIFMLLLQVPVLRVLAQRGVALSGFCLEKVPRLVEIWDKLYNILFQQGQPSNEILLAWGKMLYLLPLLAGLAPAALVILLYYPRRKKLPETASAAETAEALLQMLQDVKKRSSDVSLVRHLSGMILAIVSSCIVLFDYYMPMNGPSRMDMVLSEVFPVPHLYFVGVPLMMLAVLVIMFLFWVAALPLNGMLRLFCLHFVSKHSLEEAILWKKQCTAEETASVPPMPQTMENTGESHAEI